MMEEVLCLECSLVMLEGAVVVFGGTGYGRDVIGGIGGIN